MIGKHQLVIDASEFVKGMSVSAGASDGGFSPETDQVNIIATPGVLYAPASAVDSDTDIRLTGLPIASSPDMTFLSPTNRLFVSDDGKGYRYNGTKLTAVGIALTAAQTWTAGFTDIITFGGEAYVSSKGSLTRWQNDNTIDAGASWPFSFTTNTVPHPGIVYENNMYWGDKNLLLIQSAVGDATAPTTVLTLSADQMIVALGVDPASGLMLISTKNCLDVSGTISTINRLLWYDGNSAKVSKSTILDDAILGFHNVGNTVYVGYGNNIGYLSGAGIQWLRKLGNVTADNTELPYKHHLAHVSNTLYVVNGKQVLAFGEILSGRKVWYPAYSNQVNSNKLSVLADVGDKKLGFGFATTKFYTLDTSSVATTGTMTFYTNNYSFPRLVFIRSVFFEYADAISDAVTPGIFYVKNKSTIGSSGTWVALASLTNSSGSAIRELSLDTTAILNEKGRSFQFRYNPDTTNIGLNRIIVYYDVAE